MKIRSYSIVVLASIFTALVPLSLAANWAIGPCSQDSGPIGALANCIRKLNWQLSKFYANFTIT